MITEQEINQILLSSPMTLPDNPAGAGLKAKGVKEHFYKFIKVLAQVVNAHLEELSEQDEAKINEHNENQNAHTDIRGLISDLLQRDKELSTLILSTINEHNTSSSAHSNIRAWLQSIDRRVDDTYNLASGKSKIYPVNDVYDVLGMLTDDLNVGDKFVLAKENVPDLILFEKNSTKEAIPLSQMELLMGLELIPGKSYICNGYLFVASESGIDTSLFAKKSDLDVIEAELEQKEEKFTQRNENAHVVLQNKTEHIFGTASRVSVELPSDIDSDFNCLITFCSGASATEFVAPGEIVFTQDDCFGGELFVQSNRIYQIYIEKICGALIGKVYCCDFEVIE